MATDLKIVEDPQEPVALAIQQAQDARRGSIRIRLVPQVYMAAERAYVNWGGVSYRFELPMEMGKAQELRETMDGFFRAVQAHGFQQVQEALARLDAVDTAGQQTDVLPASEEAIDVD